MKKLPAFIFLLVIIAGYFIFTKPESPDSLGADLRVITIPQGGTGTSTRPAIDELLIGDGSGGYTFIAKSLLTGTGGGGGGGFPTEIQNGGATLNVATTTLNFTPNSFSLTENPDDTFAIRVATSTLGLLASSISDFVSTVRSSITEGVTGLTFTTGNLTLDSGYTIPTTTRAVNWDTAFGWGNHASQGYITDGNTGWDNIYGLVTATNATSAITHGTTTNLSIVSSLNLFGGGLKTTATDLCIQLTGSAALCDGNDASSAGGGGGTVSTSSVPTIGNLSYWTTSGQSLELLGSVATGTLTESILGIDLDNSTRGLVGGSASFSLTNGYTIPSTTRAVAWDNKGTGSVTSVDMSVPTGLTIANNPITTSGTLALSLTAGYTIPSTTRMVNHDTAFGWGNHSGLYDILGQATSTLGTHTTTYNHTNYNTAYSWGNHAGLYDPLGQATSSINLLTAGDGLTRTLNDFDCDTASASVFGCLSITDWATFMGKVATSSIDSLGEIETLTSVANILIENDIDASSELAALMDDETGAGNLVFSDSPTLTGGARFVGINVSASSTLGFASSTALTVSGNTVLASATSTNLFSTLGTFTNLVVNTLATFLNVVVTGLLDVGGGVLEIPNGTAPVIDSIGEIGLDSTDDQLIMADGGGTARVFGTDEFRVVSLTMASSSLQFDSGDLLAVLGNKDGLEITQFRCYVVGGTSKVVNLTDGTNDTETITCGTTMTSDTDVATNDTFTADEIGSLEMGATTGTVNYLHFEAWARITRE